MRNVWRVEGREAAPSTLRSVCSLSGLNATRAFAAKDGRWDGRRDTNVFADKKMRSGRGRGKNR